MREPCPEYPWHRGPAAPPSPRPGEVDAGAKRRHVDHVDHREVIQALADAPRAAAVGMPMKLIVADRRADGVGPAIGGGDLVGDLLQVRRERHADMLKQKGRRKEEAALLRSPCELRRGRRLSDCGMSRGRVRTATAGANLVRG